MKQTTKKVGLLAIFLLAILLVLTGCDAPEENSENLAGLPVINKEENADFTTYTDESGVNFAYPNTWISIGEELPMFLSPDGSGTSVNLTTEDVTTAISFSGYIEAAKIKIKQEMDVQGDIEQTEVNLNGRDAYRLEYVASSEDISMKVLQAVIRDGETMYILTVGTTVDNYEEQKTTIDQVLASFCK